jgi:hypothetical protein
MHLGVSGATCAETLREVGCTQRIVVISNEAVLPYDRSLLTKVFILMMG